MPDLTNIPTDDQRDAVVIFDSIVRAIALAGMYPDRVLDTVRAMIDRPGFGTPDERALALDLLARARSL
jgi:hypothetical protein